MADSRSLFFLAAGLATVLALPAAAQSDPAKLAETACARCHGPTGLSTVAGVPRLAAQQASYIVKQLEEVSAGKRKGDDMKACMEGAKSDDYAGLAAYFSAQAAAPAKPGDAALAEAGRRFFEEGINAKGVSACTSCHEAGAVGGDKHPRLAGQHRDYITKQIKAFRSGERANDKGRQMRNVAVKLSDEEIAAAAEYLSGL